MTAADLVFMVALVVVGAVAGAVNVVAGGGSFLILPLLLVAGMTAGEANATSRLGILTQNLVGVWGFHRSGALDLRWAAGASVPALAGAALGAWLALQVSDFAFKRLLALAMLGMTLWTLLARPRGGPGTARVSPWHPGIAVSFLVIGIYAGLIQAGVGFAILATTSLAGMDLVRGNAVKLAVVLLVTVMSLAIFAVGGVVHWGPGLALAAGNVVGAMVGVRLAVTRGHDWIQRVVTVTVVAMALLLWFGS